MSLPFEAVERLFSRLTATYGRDFMARYEGVDDLAVKSSWAHELSGFAKQLRCVAWALENLPVRAPNVLEFRELCRKAPLVESEEDVRLRLEHQPASKERVAAELAKLGSVVKTRHAMVDRRDWARRLIARHDAGEVLGMAQLRFAREALGIKPQAVAA